MEHNKREAERNDRRKRDSQRLRKVTATQHNQPGYLEIGVKGCSENGRCCRLSVLRYLVVATIDYLLKLTFPKPSIDINYWLGVESWKGYHQSDHKTTLRKYEMSNLLKKRN